MLALVQPHVVWTRGAARAARPPANRVQLKGKLTPSQWSASSAIPAGRSRARAPRWPMWEHNLARAHHRRSPGSCAAPLHERDERRDGAHARSPSTSAISAVAVEGSSAAMPCSRLFVKLTRAIMRPLSQRRYRGTAVGGANGAGVCKASALDRFRTRIASASLPRLAA